MEKSQIFAWIAFGLFFLVLVGALSYGDPNISQESQQESLGQNQQQQATQEETVQEETPESLPPPIVSEPEIELPIAANCGSDDYNCEDFNSCSEVMVIFESCTLDINGLDGNNNGIPCENLCEGEISEPTGESCGGDIYNCGDFSTCSEVMDVFNSCSLDVNGLDRNNDGVPCESLC